ncbi:MAG: thiamine phosphate synthase [Planctomycetota bacterium]
MNRRDALQPLIKGGIYCITAASLSGGRDNIAVVRCMLRAGVKVIQYREKKKAMRVQYRECLKIRELTRAYKAVFIVNDHADLCRLVKADGVHLGQEDLPVPAARVIIGPGRLIGVSTHSPAQFRKAMADGADYAGVGPIFETHTKEDVVPPVGLAYLDWARRNASIPYVAIGGIHEGNIDVVAHRTACIAVVSDIVAAADIVGKIKRLQAKLNPAARPAQCRFSRQSDATHCNA